MEAEQVLKRVLEHLEPQKRRPEARFLDILGTS